MKPVYVVRSGRSIAPFEEPVDSMPIGGEPWSEGRRRLLQRFGLAPVFVEDVAEIECDRFCLVVFDYVFFTRRLLKDFLRRTRGTARPGRVALPEASLLIARFSGLQELERRAGSVLFDFFACPSLSRGTSLARLRAEAEAVPVLYREKVLRFPMPPEVAGDAEWSHPLTSSVCFHIRHWTHVLMLNLLAIQIRWIDWAITHPIAASWLLLRGLAGPGPIVDRLARRANHLGRGVRIHPSAVVEGSFLAPDVTIGPGAIVRASILGAGVRIEPGADVFGSVLGAKSFVSKHSIVYASASFEAAELCMKGMQLCLVGRSASLTARATPVDTNLGAPIRVQDGERFVEFGWPVLGSCYGHEVFIGADVFVGPGRAIPNRLRIVPEAGRVLARVPEGLDPDRLYTVRSGTLVPLGRPEPSAQGIENKT